MTPRPDKRLVCNRFSRALHTYGSRALIQQEMAERLVSMLAPAGVPAVVDRLLEVGAGAGLLTSALLDRFAVRTYVANDLVAGSREYLLDLIGRHGVADFRFLEGDIETVAPLPTGLGLVVSNATVQWLHDLGRFFSRMAGSIAPGGLLAFTTFGPGNMREVAQLTEVSLRYLTTGDIVRLAGGAFEAVSLHDEERTLEFPSPEAVLRHISETGVNGISSHPWSPSRHREFVGRYRESFPAHGGVSLTYHPVYCCFRRKNT